MNVIEMDAASNNKVDDIRQVIEEVQYSPANGKYKVYIIDEVHMLTTSAFNALLKTLEEIENGEVKPVKQKDEESTYAKMLTREMGELDFQKEAVRLERYVRGLNSWPSAYTHYHGKLLKIWEADVVDNNSQGRPGEIVELQKDGFLIQTGKGCLKARQVQLEGKKRMAAGDFLRGMQMKAGDLLGREE